MATFFDKQNNMCSDSCWEEAKNYGNNKINDYYRMDSDKIVPVRWMAPESIFSRKY